MARILDNSNLPRKKYGTEERVAWAKAVGCKIPFEYDGVKGNLTVLEHQKKNYIVVGYNKRKKRLRTNQLMEFKIRDLVLGSNQLLQKLDFSQIPRKNERYDWAHSAGCKIPFVFYETEG